MTKFLSRLALAAIMFWAANKYCLEPVENTMLSRQSQIELAIEGI